MHYVMYFKGLNCLRFKTIEKKIRFENIEKHV